MMSKAATVVSDIPESKFLDMLVEFFRDNGQECGSLMAALTNERVRVEFLENSVLELQAQKAEMARKVESLNAAVERSYAALAQSARVLDDERNTRRESLIAAEARYQENLRRERKTFLTLQKATYALARAVKAVVTIGANGLTQADTDDLGDALAAWVSSAGVPEDW